MFPISQNYAISFKKIPKNKNEPNEQYQYIDGDLDSLFIKRPYLCSIVTHCSDNDFMRNDEREKELFNS